MKPFIEKKLAFFGQSRPIGNIVPGLAGTGLAIAAKRVFELREKVGAFAEMAEKSVALRLLLGHYGAHLVAIVTLEGIALDIGRLDVLAAENLFEGAPDGCRSRPRGTSHRYDRIFRGHLSLFL